MSKQILLLERDSMLRQIVAKTARTLDIGHVHEAASEAAAARLLDEKVFHGTIIAAQLKQTDPEAYGTSSFQVCRRHRSAHILGLIRARHLQRMGAVES